MKKLITSLFAIHALAASTFALASEVDQRSLDGFQVSVQVVEKNEHKFLSLSFRTNEIFSSMCPLTVSSLHVEAPNVSQEIGIPEAPIGTISFNAFSNLRSVCMMATGPHSGLMMLPLGRANNAIKFGYYNVIINGTEPTLIKVTANQAKVVDPSALPQ